MRQLRSIDVSMINVRSAKTLLLLVGLILLGFFAGTNRGTLRTVFRNPLVLTQNQGNSVSAGELKTMLANKAFTMINVHTPYEGEIERTDAFIPYDQIVANASSLPKDKNTAIILYCKTGRMSTEAMGTFKKLGYTNVKHLAGGMEAWEKSGGKLLDLSSLENEVLPKDGVELPVSWNDIGPKLVSLGVIDLTKFKEAVKVTPEEESILTKGSDTKIRITKDNSQFIVDMLWAVGLAQKSVVYDEGPMGKEYKKDAANFASTGGWTLSSGSAMNYLNRFDLVPLTREQQENVGEIAKNVYRPCCGNSTWFPDCNHGMAALAAIELMVASGVSEDAIYQNVLALNSYWFGDTYLTIATYFARQGIPWSNVNPKTILGQEYSSTQGASAIAQKVGPLPYRPTSGGGCSA